MKILIVEDDVIPRRVLTKLLSPYGIIEEAKDGVEAIEAATQALESGGPYDLICMDLYLPGTSGLDALKSIRAEEEERGLLTGAGASTIIMTTGSTESENVLASFKNSCDAYLTKPLSGKKLLETLKRCGLVEKNSFAPKVAREAKARAHDCCVLCRKPGHSVVYPIDSKGEEVDLTVSNACPLCPDCHSLRDECGITPTTLRAMRDWWWFYCEIGDRNTDAVTFGHELAELMKSGGSEDDPDALLSKVKAIVGLHHTRVIQAILEADSLCEVGRIAEVALNPIFKAQSVEVR